jgi:hypothetical protein
VSELRRYGRLEEANYINLIVKEYKPMNLNDLHRLLFPLGAFKNVVQPRDRSVQAFAELFHIEEEIEEHIEADYFAFQSRAGMDSTSTATDKGAGSPQSDARIRNRMLEIGRTLSRMDDLQVVGLEYVLGEISALDWALGSEWDESIGRVFTRAKSRDADAISSVQNEFDERITHYYERDVFEKLAAGFGVDERMAESHYSTFRRFEEKYGDQTITKEELSALKGRQAGLLFVLEDREAPERAS